MFNKIKSQVCGDNITQQALEKVQSGDMVCNAKYQAWSHKVYAVIRQNKYGAQF